MFVLDLLASPGSGKTSTILATIDALRDEFNIAVIEGDIASNVDAEKIKAQGIAAVQINTGGACHLESAMVKRAVDVLDLERLDLIIVENVGNLVCPTDFDLGENAKVMILSVPEGDDKPLKYPGVFQVAEAVVLEQGGHDARVQLRPRRRSKSAVHQLNPQRAHLPHRRHEGRRAWRPGREWLGRAHPGDPVTGERPQPRETIGAHTGRNGRRERKAADGYERAVPPLRRGAAGLCGGRRASPTRSSGLSGGMDSSIVAVMCVDAFGADHVHGVLLPGPYSSEHSVRGCAGAGAATWASRREVGVRLRAVRGVRARAGARVRRRARGRWRPRTRRRAAAWCA